MAGRTPKQPGAECIIYEDCCRRVGGPHVHPAVLLVVEVVGRRGLRALQVMTGFTLRALQQTAARVFLLARGAFVFAPAHPAPLRRPGRNATRAGGARTGSAVRLRMFRVRFRACRVRACRVRACRVRACRVRACLRSTESRQPGVRDALDEIDFVMRLATPAQTRCRPRSPPRSPRSRCHSQLARCSKAAASLGNLARPGPPRLLRAG